MQKCEKVKTATFLRLNIEVPPSSVSSGMDRRSDKPQEPEMSCFQLPMNLNGNESDGRLTGNGNESLKMSMNDVNVDSGSLSSGNKEDSNDSRGSDHLNSSGGESTGVLLTKALNTLVRSDYEVITPPREKSRTEKSRDHSEGKKKLPLFRPYEHDNGMSGDRKCSMPVQSPMLLRSNYGSTGPQWHIERKSKSESVYNQIIDNEGFLKAGIGFEKTTKTLEKKSDLAQNFAVPRVIDNIFSLRSGCKDDLDLSKSNGIAPEHTLQRSRKPFEEIPVPQVQPLRSSTPKSSPCPSPNVPLTEVDTLRGLPKHLPSPVGSGCDTVTESAPAKRQLISGRNIAKQNIEQAMIDTRKRDGISSQIINYHRPTHIPPTVRYMAEEGHRLPLKHSYKHLATPADQNHSSECPKSQFGETNIENVLIQPRSRTPLRQDMPSGALERCRSNSCPPYTSRGEPVPKAVDLSEPVAPSNMRHLPTISSRAQKGIFSNTTKSYLDAVKETWAMHHAVMTSKTPIAKPDRHTLPSFATFSEKALGRTLSEKDGTDAGRRQNEKHGRSKSESMLEQDKMFARDIPDICEKKPKFVPRFGHPKVPYYAEPVRLVKNLVDDNSTGAKKTSNETWQVCDSNNVPPVAPVLSSQEVRRTGVVPTSHSSNPGEACLKTNNKNTGVPASVKSEVSAVDPRQYRQTDRQTGKPFNPARDIYKDPIAFKPSYISSQIKPFCPQQLYDPRYLPRFGALAQPYLNPLTARAFPPELLAPQVQQTTITPLPSPSDIVTKTSLCQVPTSANSDSDRSSVADVYIPTVNPQMDQLRHNMVDSRRPLGTSVLQNTSPMTSTVQQDAKIPFNTLMCMMKVSFS